MSLLFIFVNLRDRVGRVLARALNEKRRWPLVQVSSPPPGHGGTHVPTRGATVEEVWEREGENYNFPHQQEAD